MELDGPLVSGVCFDWIPVQSCLCKLKYAIFTVLNTPSEDHQNRGIPKYTYPVLCIHNTMAWPSGSESVSWVPDCHVFSNTLLSTMSTSLFPHKGQLDLFLCNPSAHEPDLFLSPSPFSLHFLCGMHKPAFISFWSWHWWNNVIHTAVVSSCRSNSTLILCFPHILAFLVDFYQNTSMGTTVSPVPHPFQLSRFAVGELCMHNKPCVDSCAQDVSNRHTNNKNNPLGWLSVVWLLHVALVVSGARTTLQPAPIFDHFFSRSCKVCMRRKYQTGYMDLRIPNSTLAKTGLAILTIKWDLVQTILFPGWFISVTLVILWLFV